jgi:hypothetical protein
LGFNFVDCRTKILKPLSTQMLMHRHAHTPAHTETYSHMHVWATHRSQACACTDQGTHTHAVVHSYAHTISKTSLRAHGLPVPQT